VSQKSTLQKSIVTKKYRLFGDVKNLIDAARIGIARSVDATLVTLHWQIGQLIHQDILQKKRADYGQKIVHALSALLVSEYGSGFGKRNLFNMIRFAEAFPDKNIVYALRRQLSWTHFRTLIYIDDPLKREFYAELCRRENWSTRTLSVKIQNMLYERTAISRKPENLIRKELKALREEDRMSPDLTFRDPYVLNFLGLKDTYAEKDFEAAVLRELESFILELGTDFSFIARQKRITIDGEDYYMDLLFYHRGLNRLVVIDLKMGKFQAADKGQMELYLKWLDKYERRQNENAPIGLILCAEKSGEHVELLELDKSGIRVSEFLTELPPKRIFERKLKTALLKGKGFGRE